MRTISEFIFDLVRNSIEARASNVHVLVEENVPKNLFRLTIEDDGGGIKKENLELVKSPFYTTRPKSMRRVGLGLSLMDAACRQSGGELKVGSIFRRGTTITATMEHDNIDRPPLGDLAEVYTSIMMSTVENKIIFTLEHSADGERYRLKNRMTMDELNIMSYGEEGVREKLYELVRGKEKGLLS